MPDSFTSKLVILDRDGVINEDSDDYIKSVDEWIPVPGSIDAIATLSKHGYTIAIATNQSGIGREYYSEYTLAKIHNLLNSLVEEAGGKIDLICYCPHLPTDNCSCRKPKTGLLDQIEETLRTSVSGCFYIGDSLKDLQLALAKDCKPILVRSGKGATTELNLNAELLSSIRVFNDLSDSVTYILTIDD